MIKKSAIVKHKHVRWAQDAGKGQKDEVVNRQPFSVKNARQKKEEQKQTNVSTRLTFSSLSCSVNLRIETDRR